MRWILEILPSMPVPSAGSGCVDQPKKLSFYYSHGQFSDHPEHFSKLGMGWVRAGRVGWSDGLFFNKPVFSPFQTILTSVHFSKNRV